MEKNKFKEIVFVIFLLTVIIGGYILMNNVTQKMQNKDSNEVVNNTEMEITDIRHDKNKEYIYFSDVKKVMEELDIEYKMVNINFGDNSHISSQLNNETSSMHDKLAYDETLPDDAPYHKLASAEYKKEEVISYENYISLIVNYFAFDSEEIVKYLNTKTYVFDKATGLLLTNDEILAKYNLKPDEVNQKIKKELDSIKLLEKEQEIDVEGTIKGINNYALFIDKIGRLSVSILVKSNEKDYNEIIILS